MREHFDAGVTQSVSTALWINAAQRGLPTTHPNAFAQFQTNANGFSASLDGQDFGCTVSSTLYPEVLAAWPQTLSFKGLFFINWDPQGICSSLSFVNSSSYP